MMKHFKLALMLPWQVMVATFRLLTEAGDTLTTEAGDPLRTE